VRSLSGKFTVIERNAFFSLRDSSAFMVFCAVATNRKAHSDFAFPSLKQLAKATGLSVPTITAKVKRQHRTDEKRFYKKMKMYSLQDGRKQLAAYNKKSNNIPKICLNFLSPNEILEKYLGVM